MRKISLTIISFFVFVLGIFSQSNKDSVGNSDDFVSKKLKFEEANILNSYYTQNGNHSAVEGGKGSEELTDYSLFIDLKYVKYNKKGNKHKLGANLGFDYYTSASSDNIETIAITSPSYSDRRIYPSIQYSFENVSKEFVVGSQYMFSKEFDYTSNGFQLFFSKEFNEKQTEIISRFQFYYDELLRILPYELRPLNKPKYDYDTELRRTFYLSNTLNKTINSKMQMAFVLDLVLQNGFLSTPFNRVFFKNQNTASLEILPDTRFKIPIGIRANYAFNEKMFLRNFYRFYWDDWGIVSNTISTELAYKINPKFTISPGIRLYQQSASKYFGEFQTLLPNSEFRTSDYDLSNFISTYASLGLKYQPENGILLPFLNSVELKYGIYNRSDGLNAHNFAINFKLK